METSFLIAFKNPGEESHPEGIFRILIKFMKIQTTWDLASEANSLGIVN